MKRILILTAASLLVPGMAFGQDASSPAEPTKDESTASNSTASSELSSSGLAQKTYLNGIYASESGVKTNTVYLEESDASGIWSEQVASLNNAAIVSSYVNVNSIQIHSGEMRTTVINQTTHGTGLDIQNSSLELNRVILK